MAYFTLFWHFFTRFGARTHPAAAPRGPKNYDLAKNYDLRKKKGQKKRPAAGGGANRHVRFIFRSKLNDPATQIGGLKKKSASSSSSSSSSSHETQVIVGAQIHSGGYFGIAEKKHM